MVVAHPHQAISAQGRFKFLGFDDLLESDPIRIQVAFGLV